MDSINYKTEAFEGPLDLLLTLIAKKKVSILEVSLLEIIEQYLAYMEKLENEDIDYTGEFIVMAAKLLYIKSWILLPHDEDNESEEENPEEELRARLIEYAQFKEASHWLEDASFASRYLFYHKPEQIDLKELPPLNSVMNPNRLFKAFQRLLEAKDEAELLPSAFTPIIGKPRASVHTSTKNVLSKLKKNKKITFDALFVSLKTRTEKIATFLAILTLVKQGRMLLTFTEKEIICEGVMQNAD